MERLCELWGLSGGSWMRLGNSSGALEDVSSLGEPLFSTVDNCITIGGSNDINVGDVYVRPGHICQPNCKSI